MKSISKILVVGLVFIIFSQFCLPINLPVYFCDGNKLYEFWKGFKLFTQNNDSSRVDDCCQLMGYVNGVVDCWDDEYFDLPITVTSGQLVRIVGKYLEGNPELHHLKGSILVVGALRKAFPLKK